MSIVGWLFACALKAGALLAASWLGAVVLRRGTAAARHQMWTLGVVGALVVPVACWAWSAIGGAPSTVTHGRVLAGADVVITGGYPVADAAPAWPTWLAIAWAVGAGLVVLRVVRGQLAARALVRRASIAVEPSWSAARDEAAASLGLRTRVELRLSEAIGSPMTIGIVRPRVVLPVSAAAWSPDRLRAVLVHELGHVRRRDIVVQLVAQLACAVYWWNPLAWLAATRLRIEREHACDDLVLASGVAASSYASDLLELTRAAAWRGSLGAVCMVDRSGTAHRLDRILDGRPRRPLRARFRLAAGVAMLAAVAGFASTSSPPIAAPAPPLGTLSVGAASVRPWGLAPPPAIASDDELTSVQTEVARRLGALEACYERRLADDPMLAGTIVLQWTIGGTGEVAALYVPTDTVHDSQLLSCVEDVVESTRFPAPRTGTVDVVFPFVFDARGAVFDMLRPDALQPDEGC
ncbi:MAG TPA: M56 family metallopeptidase [Kofleriaceae bacterium]|nr:M56 family metallopeptidase [Kofleriaceae bacterium]